MKSFGPLVKGLKYLRTIQYLLISDMATLTITACILILCLNIENAFTCQYGGGGGGGGGGDDGGGANESEGMFTGNLSDPAKWREHWTPTKGLDVKDYNNWMNDYKKTQASKEKADLEAAGGKWPEKPADADDDWPDNWKGLGPGSGGMAPPPWAYINASSGKADICFLSPNRGPCQLYVVRWGFNPYIDECAEFVYGGCEGNANNFYSKRRCQEACVGVPSGTCVSGANLIYDTFNFDNVPDDDSDSTDNSTITDEPIQDRM